MIPFATPRVLTASSFGIGAAALLDAAPAAGARRERRPTFVLHDKTPVTHGEPAIDYMDAVLSGSTKTPTLVVTLMMGGTAFHLVFDLLEPGLRPSLQSVYDTARVDLALCVGELRGAESLPLKLSPAGLKASKGKKHAGRAAWSGHIAPMLQAIPSAMASSNVVRLNTISDHRVVVMLPLVDWQAAHAR